MIYKNGYEMADKMFEEIAKSKNHEISLKSSFQFIDFYGFIDGCTLPANEGKRQFVGRCVLKRLNKAFLDGEICIKVGGDNGNYQFDRLGQITPCPDRDKCGSNFKNEERRVKKMKKLGLYSRTTGIEEYGL